MEMRRQICFTTIDDFLYQTTTAYKIKSSRINMSTQFYHTAFYLHYILFMPHNHSLIFLLSNIQLQYSAIHRLIINNILLFLYNIMQLIVMSYEYTETTACVGILPPTHGLPKHPRMFQYDYISQRERQTFMTYG